MADDRALDGICENVRRGMVPAHIYNDTDLFALEKERLFGRAWVFVGHESEIPQDGDYVVRRVLDDSFIIARGSDGEVRAMFNMCLHRGMQVCRAEMGNASNFRCPYHGWSYRNDGRLTGLAFHQEAYGGDDGFPRSGQTLLPAPRFASYNGLLFISLDPHAEPLEDFREDFRFYLDFYTRQSVGGVELRGPQRWRIKEVWSPRQQRVVGEDGFMVSAATCFPNLSFVHNWPKLPAASPEKRTSCPSSRSGCGSLSARTRRRCARASRWTPRLPRGTSGTPILVDESVLRMQNLAVFL